MSDWSLPVGDRPEPAPTRPGPSMARAALRQATTPADFARQVKELARRNGWKVHHCAGQRAGSDNGWPHLELVRGDRLVLVHLGPTGYAEAEMGVALRKAKRVEVHAWKSRDLEAIEALLGPEAD